MEKTFEASLNQLETIVRKLESGELPLEESLKLFEKGVALSRECRERLNEAERRIEVLMKDSEGNPAISDLDPDSLRGERSQAGAKRVVFSDEADES
jgi:exodeoxyribonuclease VII small subunit